MNTIQNTFHSIKVTLQFLWRHCLTLIFSMDGFYSIATENVVIHRILLAILVMAMLDWLKMKFRLTPNSDRMRASIQTLQSQSPCNYHMVGTASYLGNMGHR